MKSINKQIKTCTYFLLYCLSVNSCYGSLEINNNNSNLFQDFFNIKIGNTEHMYSKETKELIKIINNIGTDREKQILTEIYPKSNKIKEKSEFIKNNSKNNIYGNIKVVLHKNSNNKKEQLLFHLAHEYSHAYTYNYLKDSFIFLNEPAFEKKEYEKKLYKKINPRLKTRNPKEYLDIIMPLSYQKYREEAFADIGAIVLIKKLGVSTQDNNKQFYKNTIKNYIIGYRANNFLDTEHYTYTAIEKLNKIINTQYWENRFKTQTTKELLNSVFQFVEKNHILLNQKEYFNYYMTSQYLQSNYKNFNYNSIELEKYTANFLNISLNHQQNSYDDNSQQKDINYVIFKYVQNKNTKNKFIKNIIDKTPILKDREKQAETFLLIMNQNNILQQKWTKKDEQQLLKQMTENSLGENFKKLMKTNIKENNTKLNNTP